MTDRLFAIPLILLLTGVSALAMLIPCAHAFAHQDMAVARAFFMAFILGAFGVAILALAISVGPTSRNADLDNLWSVFLSGFILPAYLAVPLYDGLGTTTFMNAYFEMVSSLTTTGASIYDPERLSGSLHLWRGIVGWFGGVLVWIMAAAVLAPLNLGGFEITSSAVAGQATEGAGRFERATSDKRLRTSTYRLAPIYIGLTLVLFLLLLTAGEDPLDAAMAAMATLSTSGISSTQGIAGMQSGFWGEVAIFLFMLFALSRLTFTDDTATETRKGPLTDPEFRLGVSIVIMVPLLLFARHWFAAYDIEGGASPSEALSALWGSMFTVLSFLSTTGFESSHWESAQDWSGMRTPGLILMGLALVGGGVATTAGGVKLMRVYALYQNGRREMERLLHPSSVGGSKGGGRRLRREGAFISWVFFMLFTLSLSLIVTILAFLGQGFEPAIVLTVASLSTTGPLIAIASDVPIYLSELGSPEKFVLCAAMVLGRMETLAIIALFNPGLWRR